MTRLSLPNPSPLPVGQEEKWMIHWPRCNRGERCGTIAVSVAVCVGVGVGWGGGGGEDKVVGSGVGGCAGHDERETWPRSFDSHRTGALGIRGTGLIGDTCACAGPPHSDKTRNYVGTHGGSAGVNQICTLGRGGISLIGFLSNGMSPL